jgi:tetratricopeptide (TPR) repeat protein
MNGGELLANFYEKTADLHGELGDLTKARESMLYSVDLYKDLADKFPENNFRQLTYSISLIKLGDLTGNPNFSNLGNRDEALRLYKSAENVLLPIYNLDSENVNHIKYMGIVYERMGTIYESEGFTEEAIWCFEESMRLRQKLLGKDPYNTEYQRESAISHEKMADVYKNQNQLEKSLNHYLEAHSLFTRLAEADPKNSLAKRSLAISYIHLGDLFYHPGQPSFNDKSQSRENLNHSKEILTNLNIDDAANTRVDFLLGLVEQRLLTLQRQ